MTLGELRRADREMPEEDIVALLQRALVGRIGSVDADGMPYVVPLSFVYEHPARRIHLHLSKDPGHLVANLILSSKVCFEVDEPGPLLATGETGCETSQAFESVICFGQARVVSDEQERERIARLFVRKYVDEYMTDRSYKQELIPLSIVEFITVEIDVMTGARRPPV